MECISNLISVRAACVDQSAVIYFTDSEGISLSTAALTADDRTIDGLNLVTTKVLQATDDVLTYLTKNLVPGCEIEPTVCASVYLNRIAKAVLYRTMGLLYKDMAVDSTRFNELIQHSENNALAKCLLYDSSFAVIAQLAGIDGTVSPGMYQLQLEALQPLINELQELCPRACVGTRVVITLP